MRWVVADFKGKKVWAGVHPSGELVVEGARVPIRYSDKAGARVYRAGAANITQQSVQMTIAAMIANTHQ